MLFYQRDQDKEGLRNVHRTAKDNSILDQALSLQNKNLLIQIASLNFIF